MSKKIKLIADDNKDWIVEYDRQLNRILLNYLALGYDKTHDYKEEITSIGLAIILFIERNPDATDEELTTVAISAKN